LCDNLDQVFLIKEADKNKIGRDRWNLPGGFIDGGGGFVCRSSLKRNQRRDWLQLQIDSLLGCYLCKKEDKSWIYVVFGATLNKRL